MGAGSSNGVGASIGLSFAMNQIGWDGLTETPSEVQAYISNSRVNASGNLSLSADGNEKIDAITLAGSAAVAVGGSAGVGVSGAGVTSINRISTNIGAYIDGDQAAGSAVAGIDAADVTLTAKDTSAINSIAGAASVAAAFGGSEGVAVSIGVALAENHIGNQIDAHIANVAMPSTGSVGNISITAENSAVINAVCAAASIAMSGGGSAGVAVSGAGAVADNTILTSTEAYVNNSTLVSSGSIDLEALSTSEINAVVVAASAAASGGGTAGVGASVGASLVRNLIGWDASSAAADFTTDDDLVHLTTGNTVKVVGGVRDGDVYEYLGDEVTRYTFTSDGGTQSVSTDDLVNVPSDYSGGTGAGGIYKYTGSETTSLDLSSQDYTGDDWELTGTNAIDFGDSGNWKLVLADDIDDAALVRARIVNSDVTAAGDLTLNAEANETINSTAVAGSVAIGGAGTVGVAVSGTGVGTGNWVRTFVDASIDGNSGAGTSSHEIHARNIILDASDNATITTNAIGASIAGSGGGVAGVSVTIGMSASINEVSNEVEAFIQNVAEVEATGDITLNASVAPASSTTADHGTGESSVALTAGDTVLVADGYDNGGQEGRVYAYRGFVADYVSSSSDGENEQTVNEGDTVEHDGSVYQYVGGSESTKDSATIDLSTETYTSDQWETIASPDTRNLSTEDYSDTSLWELADGTITARVAAASLAAAGAGVAGVGVSGAGAVADNVILTKTNAFIENSSITSADDIALDANNASKIIAAVVSASVSIGGAGVAGVGVSIGASTAQNRIGWKLGEIFAPAEIQAYLQDTEIQASGDLSLTANADETIDAVVLSGSAAIAGAGVAGVGVSGSGVFTMNRIATQVKTFIQGDGDSGIITGSLSLDARDSSKITATAGSASIAGGFAGVAGVSVSVGAACAYNTVTNDVWSYIADADNTVQATDGALTISAVEDASIRSNAVAASLSAAGGIVGVALSGAGADAHNIISDSVKTYISDSKVSTPNRYDYTSDEQITTLETGDRVLLESGEIYEYIGTSRGSVSEPVGLSSQNYAVTAAWKKLDSVASQDITLDARNTSSIDALVGAASGAVAGGLVAVAGSVGASFVSNTIGSYNLYGTSHDNEALAYVDTSEIYSAGDLMVHATSGETMTVDAFAGSVAIAAGIGAAVAGAGVQVRDSFATTTDAWLENSSATVVENIDIQALSSSQVERSNAVAGAVSAAGGLSISVAVTLVDNTIANDVHAGIVGTAATTITAGGNVLVDAEVEHADVLEAGGVGTAVSGGGLAASGVGVDISNTVDNTVVAEITGPVTVTGGGLYTTPATEVRGVGVRATQNASLEGDAAGLSVSYGFAAAGVGQVQNIIQGSVDARIQNAQIFSYDTEVKANAHNTILKTMASGVAGSLYAVNTNLASADISTTVSALVSNADLYSTGDIRILADGDNWAQAKSAGGSFGGIAVGAMLSEISLGNAGTDDVLAGLGDDSTVQAGSLTVSATATDDLLAESIAASAGAVGLAGASSIVLSNNATLARIGDNVSVNVDTLSVQSVHTQSFDSSADSVAFGLAAGTGAVALNTINSKADVAIGTGSGDTSVTAGSIYIKAINTFSKDQYANSNNLNAGSAGLGTLSVLSSGTDINSRAVVDMGTGTNMTALGSGSSAGTLEIEALNAISATDSVRVETVSGYSLSIGLSRIEANTLSGINLNGAVLENTTGDVSLAVKTKSEIRPSANLFSASAFSGTATADVTATNNASNVLSVNNSTIKGSDVNLYAGRTVNGQTNILEASSNAEMTLMSFGPSIAVPLVTATINEVNTIEIQGTSSLKALQDVNLIANTGIGGNTNRATTDGLALSLSAIPYGMEVPDGSSDTTTNTVSIGTDVAIEAGLNNMSIVQVLPFSVGGVSQLDTNRLGTQLNAQELTALGLDEGLKYEYSELDLTSISFGISTDTIVQLVDGYGAGGTVGHYYMYRPETDGSDAVVLEKENYADSSRWRDLGTSLADAYEQNTVYQSNVTVAFREELEGKFYVIKPVELDAPTLSYENVSNLLLEQRNEVLDWMASHATDAAAIARYQVQLDEIDADLEELGLTQYIIEVNHGQVVNNVADGNNYRYLGETTGLVLSEEDYGDTAVWQKTSTSASLPSDSTSGTLVVKQELDSLYLNLPDVYASPGSIFIQADGMENAGDSYSALVANGQLTARAGAEIDLINKTPFTMVVNDAIVLDNQRVEIIDGVYTTFAPGNVYVNGQKLTDASDADDPTISIIQDAYPSSQYDLGGLTLPKLDQDMYLAGDVINENGDLTIDNREGSIITSGEVRAEDVTILAAKDFSLNSEGWFHTNQDPRQYIDYNNMRADAVSSSSGTLIYSDPTSELESAIQEDESRILAQGKIVITARYLDINGLIQSGVDTIGLTIDAGFNPGSSTVSFTDDDGNTLNGISFADDVPVDGYFDASRNAIVVEDIAPEGGSITLAGDILSTGNGRLKVANGYTSVDIDNNTDYELILENIDTTTDREGIITIIDTGRMQKDVYTLNAEGTGITQTTYAGSLSVGDLSVDGGVSSSVAYTLTGTTLSSGLTTKYELREGLIYVWVEGQDSTKTTITNYEKKSFNLFGDNAFADLLAKDDSWVSQETIYTDKQPLLESETLEIAGESGAPSYVTDDTAYSIDFEKESNTAIEGKTNITHVSNGNGAAGTWYKYVGTNGTDLYLDTEDYSNGGRWKLDSSYSAVKDPDDDIGYNQSDLDQYLSSYKNKTVDGDTWTTGGGWLRKKTVHTKITTVEGLKDVYTNTLEADSPIEISFIQGPTSPVIDVYTRGDLFLEGDIESSENGTISLESAYGSITSADTVAIYGAAPDIDAGSGSEDIVRVNVEGDKGTLNVSAGGDITVRVISSDNASSSLALGAITSGYGDVFLQANNGITAASGSSCITGDRVELFAGDGLLGSAEQALRVNSNTGNSGGLAVKAGGDVNILETTGDLKLIEATTWDAEAAIYATGDIRMETLDGAILDGIVEQFRPGDESQGLTYNDLSAAQKADYDNGLFTLDAATSPVSPGLMSFLYPYTTFMGSAGTSSSMEISNITGQNITLIAGNGGLGEASDVRSLHLSNGWSNLSDSDKEILATATAEDIIGVQYALYQYTGENAAGVNLNEEDFSTGSWSRIDIDCVTGTDRFTSQQELMTSGKTVLVQYSEEEYGLYAYTGANASLNLARQNYDDKTCWEKVSADHSTDETDADLTAGDLVLNKYTVEYAALQLQDDVDIEASENVTINAGGNVSVETAGRLNLNHVEADGDVRLKAGGSILDMYTTNSTSAIAASGDLILNAGTVIRGTDGTSMLRTELSSS
ncbi:MAG: hypothetical protein WC132_05020, partial [Methanomethylophilus sp.]